MILPPQVKSSLMAAFSKQKSDVYTELTTTTQIEDALSSALTTLQGDSTPTSNPANTGFLLAVASSRKLIVSKYANNTVTTQALLSYTDLPSSQSVVQVGVQFAQPCVRFRPKAGMSIESLLRCFLYTLPLYLYIYMYISILPSQLFSL